jgi:hypothetical protein
MIVVNDGGAKVLAIASAGIGCIGRLVPADVPDGQVPAVSALRRIIGEYLRLRAASVVPSR